MTTTRQPAGDPRAVFAATGGELLLLILVFVLAGLLVANLPGLLTALGALARAVFGPPTLAPADFRVVVAVLITPLATLLAVLFHRLFARGLDGDRDRGPLPAPAPLAATAGQTLLHLLAALLGSWLLALAMHLVGFPVAEQPLVVEIVAVPRGPEVGILAVSAVALAPLGEELLFRGQLFRRLAARAGLAPAYLASALLFAAVHMNLQGFVVYAWLALVFAHAYVATGRLGAAVAVHLGNNAVTLAFLLYAPQAAP